MIENTRKILKKLIDNVDKYNVVIRSWGEPDYMIYFKYNNIICTIRITESNISWGTRFEKSDLNNIVSTKLDEYYQYEILDLCQKLKRECENYTSTMFRNFVDESNNESDDDLE